MLIQAEMVAMLLRWIPEDITVHNEDLEGLGKDDLPSYTSINILSFTYYHSFLESFCIGDRRRALLRGLTQSLPEILPLLYNVSCF